MKKLLRQIKEAVFEKANDTSSSSQSAATTSAAPSTAVPATPRVQEAAQRDPFTFETIQGERRPGQTEELIAKMAENMPVLQDLLATQSLDEQTAIIKRNLQPEAYERLLLNLVTIVFLYQVKDRRIKEALALAQLKYRLAAMLPEDWDPARGVGLSPARHVADALQDLGGIYADLGEPSRALDYYRQAETWYARDDRERMEHGITAESEFDRLFHERDVRASLFESMALLYRTLGDRGQEQEYTRRAEEIDRSRPTTQSRIRWLIGAGNGADNNGDYDSALRAFHEALDLAVADPNALMVTRDVAMACHHIGDVLIRLRLFRQALRYHGRALELNRRAGHLERMSYDYQAIGRIFEARSDLGDPLEQYQAALSCASVQGVASDPFIWKAQDGTVFRVLDPDLAAPAALAAARVYRQRNAYDRAHELLSLAIDLGEIMRSNIMQEEYRIGFQASRMEAYEAMIKLHGQLATRDQTSTEASGGRAAQAWQYVERARGRAFLDSLSTSFIPPPREIPQDLYEQEELLIERLSALSEGRHATTADQRATWDEYEDTRMRLEQVRQTMLAVAPSAADYVDLRRGQPIRLMTVHELLRE
jgi:tetratricopeptide (TPR) repeat protein